MRAKPSTKKMACALTRQRTLLSNCASPTVEPAMYDRYPGTSGKTQGERKETRPAMNAARKPKCASVIPPATTPLHQCTRDGLIVPMIDGARALPRPVYHHLGHGLRAVLE